MAAAGVAGVFGALSLASYDEAESLYETHQDCSDDAIHAWGRADDQANVTNVALGTAVVAALLVGWFYFTSDDSEPSDARLDQARLDRRLWSR